MGTTSEKLTYLNTTKEKIRDSINLTGANLTSEDTFRSYASKLKQGYIDIINNGIDTLYNNFPKVSGIGSNLSLTPTYEAPMKLNEIDGNTLQDGTPTPDTPVPIENVTGNQEIKVTGKNLCNNVALSNSNNDIFFYFDKDISQTFTLSAIINSATSGNSIYLILNGSSLGKVGEITGSANTKQSVTITLTNEIYEQIQNSTARYLQLYKNNAGFTLPTDAQIENGSSATEYEPYKGNTYEVNLGKNLFNSFIATKPSWQSGNLEINEDGSFTVSENPGSNNYFQTSQKLKDFCPSLNVGDTVYLYLETTNSNKYIYIGQSWINGESKTLTETMLNSNFIIYGGYGQTDTIKIMITKGLDTNYSPYFTPIELNKIGDYQDSIKKSTGKNLFDKDNVSIISGGYINSSTGEIVSGGTSSVINNISVISDTTYTLTAVGKNKIAFYDSNNNYLSNITSNLTTFTTPANCKYIKIQLATETLDINTIQLEIGSTATDYEPYGKVWYVEKQIGKVVLNGSETQWTRWFSTPGVYSCSNLIQTINNATAINCISNYYSNTYSRAYVRDNLGTIDKNIATNGGELIIANKSYTTLSDFKTWLSTHNTTVYTILATPEYTEITNTELIEDLETLYTAKSQEGTTNISITSEDLEMILNVSALKGDA